MTARTPLGIALMALALAGCDDPKPGLQDEVRVEKVVDCKDAVGRFAKSDRKKDQLCECLTGRLAFQELTIEDLSGPKQDRAMEQLRWCMQQVGLIAKPKAAASAAAATGEAEEEGTDGNGGAAPEPTGSPAD